MFLFQRKEKDMENQEEWRRRRAIERLKRGDSPAAICAGLGRTKRWLYKWLERYKSGDPEWYREHSRQPSLMPSHVSREVEEVVKFVRLELYNRGEFCGAQAILWRLEEESVIPLPSLRTINRILARNDLTCRRTGRYEPKGKKYPALQAPHPGSVHQADFVGPCYVSQAVRFYSFHAVDLSTGRCGIEPVFRGRQEVVQAVWPIWLRLGLPKYLQVDNDAVFYGSPTHPRGMGKLIRLCLPQGIEPCFIPLAEPWRNGVVEKFNDNWRDKFLSRTFMSGEQEVRRESLAFEQRHNSRYRYSKLGGRTPLEALVTAKTTLRFPATDTPPKLPLPKPAYGQYHVIRFIRSDGVLNLFGEKFLVPPECVYEYVWATVDVTNQRLRLYLDRKLLDEREYLLR
jgi:transposase InsO family protein